MKRILVHFSPASLSRSSSSARSLGLRRRTIGTAFTYQGCLDKVAGGPVVDGLYDFGVALYDGESKPVPAGGQLNPNQNFVVAAQVTNGLFTIVLDFGWRVSVEMSAGWKSTSIRMEASQSIGCNIVSKSPPHHMEFTQRQEKTGSKPIRYGSSEQNP